MATSPGGSSTKNLHHMSSKNELQIVTTYFKQQLGYFDDKKQWQINKSLPLIGTKKKI